MKPGSTPTPRGWQGGNKDFEVTRTFDGHIGGMVGDLYIGFGAEVEDLSNDDDD